MIMIRCGIPCCKMDPARRPFLMKLSSARISAVHFSQLTSAQSDELFEGAPQTVKTYKPRQVGGVVNGVFKSVDFHHLKNKDAVRLEIKEALTKIQEDGCENRAFNVIKSCGGSWFDVGKDTKNNVLTRFMDSYLAKVKISPRIGNRLLLSYAENKKNFDSKLLLKSFLDAGVRPNNETYCAIIQLEIARGNFQSGLDVYKFCQDQNLNLTPAAILSLITGSVVKKSPDLTLEFEQKFDSLFEDFERSDLLKTLAVSLGHAETGSLEELRDFIRRHETDTSNESKGQFLKAFCFLYKALAERQSGDSVSQCKAFLEQMKPNITPELLIADKVIGVTSAHLYSNQLVDASLELKKAVPRNSAKLWSRISDQLLITSVISNNKDPMVMLASKLRGFKDAQVLERPLTTLIQQSIRDDGGLRSEVATVMSSYLENPEVTPKPHFYFPFFIKGPGNSLPTTAHVEAFCECLEQEPEEHFKYTAETFENILKTQPAIFEHLMSMQHKLPTSSKFRCIMIKLLLTKGRYAEAVGICESLSEVPEFLAFKLLDSLLVEVSHDSYCVNEFAKIFGKCFHSLSEEGRQASIEKLLFKIKEELVGKRRDNFNGFIKLLGSISQEKCFANNTPSLYKIRQNIGFLDGAIQKLFNPDAFLRENVFSRNVLELSDDKRKEMLQMLTSENTLDLPSNQKEDKRIILEASLGNFGPLEDYLVELGKSEDPIDGHAKTLLSTDGRTDILLEILFTAGKTELALEVLKRCRLNRNLLDPHSSYFASLKTRPQLEAVQNWIVSGLEGINKRRVAAAFADHLLKLEEKDLLKDFAEKCFSEMSFVYPVYIYFNDLCETESLETCKEFFDIYHQKVGLQLLRQPMISACVRFSTNPLSKEILTQVLKTNGSNSENEKSAGDVLLAYLQTGKVDKAKTFAKNRLVSMQELHVQQILAKKNPELVLVLTEVDGKTYSDKNSTNSIGNYVFNQMKIDWNKAVDDKSHKEYNEFCKSVIETIVQQQLPLDKLAFLRFHEVANLIGVSVPAHYARLYSSNYRYKLWSSISNGDFASSLEVIRQAYGKISAHSKNIWALLDLVEQDRSFDPMEESFLNFLAFNRSRIEQGSTSTLLLKVMNLMKGQSNILLSDRFNALLKAFASSELNRCHRVFLVDSTYQLAPSALFSSSLAFYLTYNRNDTFADFVTRDFIKRRGTAVGVLALSKLRSVINPEEFHASADSLSKATQMMETALLHHLSREEIEQQVQQMSRYSNDSLSVEADAEPTDLDADSLPSESDQNIQ